jgi:hypothetical protein
VNGKECKSAGVYAIPKTAVDSAFVNMLNATEYTYTFDFDGFIKQYKEQNAIDYGIINPDILYNIFKNSNIKYLLLPRIRIYTPQNTGQYINTIHQYVNYIDLKYPNRFKLIHTIGKDEICELVEFEEE